MMEPSILPLARLARLHLERAHVAEGACEDALRALARGEAARAAEILHVASKRGRELRAEELKGENR